MRSVKRDGLGAVLLSLSDAAIVRRISNTSTAPNPLRTARELKCPVGGAVSPFGDESMSVYCETSSKLYHQ